MCFFYEIASSSSLLLSAPPSARGGISAPVSKANNEFFPSSSGKSSDSESTVNAPPRLDFEVTDFFVCGSPLGLVLAYRKIRQTPFDLGRAFNDPTSTSTYSTSYSSSSFVSASPSSSNNPASVIPRPAVQQIYNLFHPTDPLACRLEPLLSAKFSRVPPVNVPRYQKYPMGDGVSLSLIEFVQSSPLLFAPNSGGEGGAVGVNSNGKDGTDLGVHTGGKSKQHVEAPS